MLFKSEGKTANKSTTSSTSKKRKKEQQKKDAKAAASTRRYANEIIPIVDVFNDAFKLKNGKYMDLISIKTKDLVNASEESVNTDLYVFTRLFKSYADDMKIISLNFPTNTKSQQAYFQHKLTHSNHPLLIPVLEEKLEELREDEKTSTSREHYIMFWGDTYDELQKNASILFSSLGKDLSQKCDLSKKLQVLFSMNNMSSAIFFDVDADQYIEPPNKNELVEKYGYNPYLIKAIQPMGGIELNHTDYVRTGEGFETCLYIYGFPKQVDRHWLTDIVNNPGTITTIDVSTINAYQVKKDLKNSIAEYRGRIAKAKNTLEAMEAQELEDNAKELAYSVQSLGEVIKRVTARIYIAGENYTSLMERAKSFKDDILAPAEWLACINLNEMKYEWTSKFLSATTQSKDFYSKRNGKPVPAKTLGGGDPFHYTSLNDTYGSRLGHTLSNGKDGKVLFDLFASDDIRTSYNFIATGMMGRGKSTLLKKLLRDRAARGDYVRVIDVTGEFSDIAQSIGGKVVYLDGDGGILNLLQINKASESDTKSYSSHISNLVAIYRFLAPEATHYERLVFEDVLMQLYEQYGMTPEQFKKSGLKVTELRASEYPILEEVIPVIEANEKLETNLDTLKYLRNVKTVIANLVANYGDILNGYTSIDNLIDTQIVVYNIKELTREKSEIFDAQLFNALALCWANAVKVGTYMKSLYENKQIDFRDIRHFLLLIDESHKTINALKPYAVDQVTTYIREGRKYFAGIGLASQSIRDYVPEGVGKEAYEKIKTMFELCQYKFILAQDSNSLETMRRIFSEQFTETEIAMVPRLERGQCILSINGFKNVTMEVEVTAEELSLFKGGV